MDGVDCTLTIIHVDGNIKVIFRSRFNIKYMRTWVWWLSRRRLFTISLVGLLWVISFYFIFIYKLINF